MLPDHSAEVIDLRPQTQPLPDVIGDQDSGTVPGPGPGERKPVIPAAWQRDAIKETIRHHAGRHWHATRYHGLRAPGYVAKCLFYLVRGGGRLAGRLLRWVTWPEGAVLESQAVAAGRAGHHDALAAHRQGRQTRGQRVRVLGVAVVVLGTGVAALVAFAPLWADVLAALAVAAVLTHHGRPHGRPVIAPATVPTEYERLTPDVIVRALGALGIAAINQAVKDGRAASFVVSPVQRDGSGWRAEIDLPFGVTATDIIERRDSLASGLRRPLGCVWPEPVTDEHAGRLVLFVSDQPLSKARQPAYPLAKAGTSDIFGPLPFGTDQRGRAVTVTLMFANALIGSIPRQGKTVALRLLLLAAALDVRVELRVFELKGTGDLDSLGMVAHDFGSGADDDTIRAALKSLRQVAEVELVRRARKIKELPSDVCPDKKVTPALAGKRPGLHPLVFALDEAQEAFSHPEYGADFGRYAEQVIKRGPALGIMLLIGTQRPDAKSLPPAVSSNVVLRFALKVMDQVANDMILGTSAYKAGIRATMFSRNDKGIGYLRGETDDAQIVKTYNVDSPAAEKIAVRARQLRQAAGRITGYAAGADSDTAPARDVRADILAMFRDGEPGLQWQILAGRLSAAYPDRWHEVSPDALSAECRALGIESVSIKQFGSTRRGVRRADLEVMTP